MNTLFDEDLRILSNSLRSCDSGVFGQLVYDCKASFANGGKIIATGLDKNVPICENFVGTMSSLGMPAAFLHINSAVHGDLGIVRGKDVIIILTRSGGDKRVNPPL